MQNELVLPEGLTQPKLLSQIRNLTGQKFNRLTVYGLIGRARKKLYWLCRCDCGKFKAVVSQKLTRNSTVSCGCYQRERLNERSTSHGMSHTRVYRVWGDMVARCYTPSQTSYPWYGAKGVTVCDRWRYSFENFLADMGEPPSRLYSIERKNGLLGYSPENCIWDTKINQARNQGGNAIYVIGDQSHCLTEWAEIANQHYKTAWSRIDIGWTIEEALGFKERPVTEGREEQGRFLPNPQAEQNADLSNQRFGKLTALRPDKSGRHVVWHCVCDCGRATLTRAVRLIRGEATQCRSCAKRKNNS